jgi:hypothetical protein
MKKINESQLLDKVSKLKEYIAVVESEQQVDEFWNELGQAAGTVAGAVAAPVRAVADAGQWVYNNAGQLVDKATGAIKQAAGNVAQGVQQGWQNTDPAKIAQAVTGGGTAGAPATATKPAAKSDPAVMKIQQDLIARGAKIKADGVMGPATQAAMKQFPGAQPAASLNGQSFADANKAAIAAGAPAGGVQPGANPNISDATRQAAQAQVGTTPAPAATAMPIPNAPAPAAPKPMTAESVQYDDLARLVSLVHHR